MNPNALTKDSLSTVKQCIVRTIWIMCQSSWRTTKTTNTIHVSTHTHSWMDIYVYMVVCLAIRCSHIYNTSLWLNFLIPREDKRSGMVRDGSNDRSRLLVGRVVRVEERVATINCSQTIKGSFWVKRQGRVERPSSRDIYGYRPNTLHVYIMYISTLSPVWNLLVMRKGDMSQLISTQMVYIRYKWSKRWSPSTAGLWRRNGCGLIRLWDDYRLMNCKHNYVIMCLFR